MFCGGIGYGWVSTLIAGIDGTRARGRGRRGRAPSHARGSHTWRSHDPVGEQPVSVTGCGQRRTEAHAMQVRAVGRASRRARPIGAPQRSHRP